MNHVDLLDWTSFDAGIEARPVEQIDVVHRWRDQQVGYRTTMEALEKARAVPTGARLFLA